MKKMIMKYFYFLLAIVILGCNSAGVSKEKIIEKSKLSDSLKNTIRGRWGGPGEKEPVFEITMDSVYFFDRNKAYSYTILEGSLIIKFPESEVTLKNIRVNKDTLFSEDEKGFVTKGIRFK